MKPSVVMNKCAFLHIALLLFSAVISYAQPIQDIQFDQILSSSEAKSLSQNSIFSIIQDKYGFMWFGTQAGLDRYDGHEFVTYRSEGNNDTSITKGDVTALFESQNKLWVGTEKGLSTIEYDAEIKDFVVKRLSDSIVVTGITGTDKSVFIATERTIYNEELDTVYHFQHSFISKDTIIKQIVYVELNSASLLIVATSKGLFKIDKEKNKLELFNKNDRRFKRKVTGLYYNEKKARLVVGLNRNIYQIDLRASGEIISIRKIDYYPKNKPNLEFNHFLIDSTNNFWAGTRNSGVFYHTDAGIDTTARLVQRKTEEQFSLSSNSISSLYQSRDGVVWVGTHGKGINKWASKKQRFYHAFAKFELPNKNASFKNDVWSIHLDATRNQIYIGTDGDGIAVYDAKDLLIEKKENIAKWISYKEKEFDIYKDISKENVVKCIYPLQKDSLLIGTSKGLFKLACQDQIYNNNILKNKTKDASINIIVPYKSGYLVGTTNKGLLILNQQLKIDTILSENSNIWTILQNSIDKDKFWLGTKEGLFQLNTKNDTFSIQTLKERSEIHALLQQEDTLWIGTGGEGLKKYHINKDNIIQKYDRNNRLTDNVVYGIQADKNKNLWVSTNKGIVFIDVQKNIFNHYLVEDGLQSEEFNSGAFLSTFYQNENFLFFGGVNGFNWFSPNENLVKNIPVQLAYTFIKSDTSGVIRGVELFKGNPSSIHLPYKGRAVDINIAIFDYHDSKNNKVWYQAWIPDNSKYTPEYPLNNILMLSGSKVHNDFILDEGVNCIEINARKSYGNWNEGVATINIEVAPSEVAQQLNKVKKINYIFIFSITGLCILGIAALWFFIENRQYINKLSSLNKGLNTLQKIINEITRLDQTDEIFETATNHLTGNYFDFGYAIIYMIDLHQRKIIKQYHSKDKKLFNHPPFQWRNLIKDGEKVHNLREKDVLEVVFREGLIVKIEAENIKILEGKNVMIELDELVYERNNQNQVKRLFLPIIRRAKEIPGQRAADYTFGIVEVGTPIKRERNIADKDLLINLKLYINNCAQVYYKAFEKENLIKNQELLTKNYSIPDHKKYLQHIIRDLVRAYQCDIGDIALVTHNENEKNWTPDANEIITYNIDAKELEKIRQKKSEKLGIFRYTFKNRKYYFSGDLNNDPYYIKGLKKVNSQLSVPLETYNKFIGTINLYSKNLGFFDEFKAKNIQYLANEIADIYHRKKANSSLNKLVLPLNIALDEKLIYKTIIDLIEDYFLTKFVSFWKIKKIKNRQKFNTYYYLLGSQELGKDFNGLSNKIINLQKNNKLYHIKEETTPPFPTPENKDFQTIIIAPIYFNTEQLGYIQILSRRKIEKLFPEDEIFLTQITTKAAMSIRSAEMFKSFVQMSSDLVEEKQEGVYEKITNFALRLFSGNLVILSPFSKVHAKYCLNDAIISGELLERLTESEAQQEPKNDNLVNIILKKGSAFVEDEEQYLILFDPKKRNWSSKKWEQSFWYREDIKSFAALRLDYESQQLGVLFLNYKEQERQFSEDDKRLLNTFGYLAAQTIVYARILEENKKFKNTNIQISKPYIESAIISGIAHNTGNLIIATQRRFNELNNRLEEQKGKDKEIDIEWMQEELNWIEKPLKLLREDYNKLERFRRTDEVERLEQVNLKTLIEDSLNLVKGKAYKNKVKIDFSSEHDIFVQCDTNYIQHAILNLLNNAIDEFKSYGGKIRVELNHTGNTAIIKVIDNGPGIREEHFSKIFRPYFTTKKTGTGIGLTITKYIVEDVHKGKLEFYSKWKKGTTFEIHLPVTTTNMTVH